MGLNADQTAASAAFQDFRNSDASIFALLGYAGTGKSFMTSHLLKNEIMQSERPADADQLWFNGPAGEVVIACPTHKAMNVGRRFLTDVGIDFEIGYDKFHHQYGVPITGTTAQLLGLRPIIVDDQTSDQMHFGKADRGLIEKIGKVDWLVIDEVSMLAASQLRSLDQLAQAMGFKVLIVGDPGQLPPVEAEPIDFDGLPYVARLEQIMRQQGDSAIPHLARAIRRQEDWSNITGPGVDHFRNPAGAFIDELDGPPAEDERDRATFVAYRNARVNAVQQAACMKVYGHGRLEVAQGEVVIANTPLQKPGRGMPVALCNNGDVLVAEEVGGKGEWGTEVQMRRVQTGASFTTEFLNEVEINDKTHPYNVELKRREVLAQQLQKAFNKGDRSVDTERRSAWADFFSLKNSAVLSASHPFAITSHKSQGSTYRQTFVDAQDMAPFDHRALYVGVTRPSEELVIG
jgi:exodeoxyribonuclease-5